MKPFNLPHNNNENKSEDRYSELKKKRFHESVLKKEILPYINREKTRKFTLWDATAGNGGHIRYFLEHFPDISIYASDVDSQIIELLKSDFKDNSNIIIKKGNYSENIWPNQTFDFILLDLGISSLHFDYFSRGFSYRYDEILDMRLDPNHGIPLYEWLNKASDKEIYKVIYNYGEIRDPSRFIFNLRSALKEKKINRTYDLKKIIEISYPRYYGKKKKTIHNPASKIFQAFRIFLNRELDHLTKTLESIPKKLNYGGRLFIISFHSLEDRLVKTSFKNHSFVENKDPLGKSNMLPGEFRIITKKPITPSQSEIEENPRARSAKLRILERISK